MTDQTPEPAPWADVAPDLAAIAAAHGCKIDMFFLPPETAI